MDRAAFGRVQDLAMSYFVSRALHVAADLALADLVAEAPTAISAVAQAAQCNERALVCLLRVLSAHGIFDADEVTVRHTEASRLLRSDHPYSLRAFAQMFGLPVMWRSAEALAHSIRTGDAAAPIAFAGAGFWGYLADNPEHARIFDAAMAAKTRGQIAAILSSYDFSDVRSIADIGGGRGLLLSAIVQRYPGITATVFDLPAVVAAAETAGERTSRLRFQGGDVFKDPLPNCELYVLMAVLHDWPDEPAEAIIRAIGRAASPRSRLLIIEAVIAEGSEPAVAKTLDLAMLTFFGGRQRTATEYRDLLDRTGFRLLRRIDTEAGVSIFEGAVA